MQSKIIVAQTAAKTVEFNVERGSPVALFSAGLAGAETIAIEVSVCDTWTALKVDGSAVVMDANTNHRMISGPGYYRLVKPSTAGAVSVELVQ